eukprot:164869-Chlamydomonas_euryale.AAC.2
MLCLHVSACHTCHTQDACHARHTRHTLQTHGTYHVRDFRHTLQVECFDTVQPSPLILAPGVPHFHTPARGSSSEAMPSPLAACPEAVAGHGSRVVLLGESGTLYCSRLMSWQERLRTLQELGKWPLALALGLRFYKVRMERLKGGVKRGGRCGNVETVLPALLQGAHRWCGGPSKEWCVVCEAWMSRRLRCGRDCVSTECAWSVGRRG